MDGLRSPRRRVRRDIVLRCQQDLNLRSSPTSPMLPVGLVVGLDVKVVCLNFIEINLIFSFRPSTLVEYGTISGATNSSLRALFLKNFRFGQV